MVISAPRNARAFATSSSSRQRRSAIAPPSSTPPTIDMTQSANSAPLKNPARQACRPDSLRGATTHRVPATLDAEARASRAASRPDRRQLQQAQAVGAQARAAPTGLAQPRRQRVGEMQQRCRAPVPRCDSAGNPSQRPTANSRRKRHHELERAMRHIHRRTAPRCRASARPARRTAHRTAAIATDGRRACRKLPRQWNPRRAGTIHGRDGASDFHDETPGLGSALLHAVNLAGGTPAGILALPVDVDLEVETRGQ